MSLQKIPKEQWMKFTEDEKRFHELEYKKAFEKNRRLMIISTRAIALICVFALLFLGFALLQNAKEYGQIKDKYGSQAFCYLCGLETHKSCECVYYSTVYGYDNYKLTDDYILQLAESNTDRCNGSRVVGSQGNAINPQELPLLE